jgi:hypothetical protein
MQRSRALFSRRQALRHANEVPGVPVLRRLRRPRLLLAPLATFALLALSTPAAADDDVPIDQLPPAVVQAIQQRFPGAKLEDAERKTRDGQQVFEVEIEVGNDDKEVTVTPEGQILKVDD